MFRSGARGFAKSARSRRRTKKKLSLEEAAIEDRQRALNDRRMLEGIRRDAMDSMRRYFLMNCPAGRTDK